MLPSVEASNCLKYGESLNFNRDVTFKCADVELSDRFMLYFALCRLRSKSGESKILSSFNCLTFWVFCSENRFKISWYPYEPREL